ncbi:G-box-binding factor 1-like isoform X2 [Chenopodium quinoa]|uniref:G-box-binding factor 1-like isoform X2 n=1 Tax=Chenopodium quinoa TaxID=63459 RepID=UPI000B78393E|nr:G-box-binding factor 1-like isoform X2 [Chenopodium quinoa]
MGAAEEQTPSKPSKATSSAQETQAAVPSYPDWSGPMQAYYGNGATPPFFASTVAAPAPHPYMWAGQTPNPAVALETEGKNLDVKDQNSAKKSKGNSGMGNEKAVETGKATSGSGNEGASQSAESGSEGSSDGSDDNNQQENSATKKGSFDLMLEDGANAQNSSGNAAQGSVPGKPVVAATNLNIGMDLWNTSAAGGVKLRPNTGVASAVAPAMVGREGLMPDHQWIQDERELKRQKRKQSNRESARRSRLRKQAECEELQRRVESLNNENSSLREELKRLSAECEKLTSENNSIKEELTQTRGPDSLQSLGENNASGEADS